MKVLRMNPFMLSEQERMLAWRELRAKVIATPSILDKLNLVAQWWAKAPLCRYSIDSHSTGEWPTPWELLNENVFCYSSLAYMMAETLILSGFDSEQVRVIFVRERDDERLVVLVDNKYVLNLSHGEILLWETLKQEVSICHEFRYDGERFI